MKGFPYTRLISQHVYVNLYSRFRRLIFFRNYLSYRSSILSLLFNRFQPRLLIYRPSNWYSHCHRSKYSPWFMLSGVSCHFWNNKGISEDEIWETVSDFDQLFGSINSSKYNNDATLPSTPPCSSARKETPKSTSSPTSNSHSNYSIDEDGRSSDEDHSNEINTNNHDEIEDLDTTKKLLSSKGWEAIILRDDFQVWRREINSNGLYQYKGIHLIVTIPLIMIVS